MVSDPETDMTADELAEIWRRLSYLGNFILVNSIQALKMDVMGRRNRGGVYKTSGGMDSEKSPDRQGNYKTLIIPGYGIGLSALFGCLRRRHSCASECRTAVWEWIWKAIIKNGWLRTSAEYVFVAGLIPKFCDFGFMTMQKIIPQWKYKSATSAGGAAGVCFIARTGDCLYGVLNKTGLNTLSGKWIWMQR